MLKEEISWSNDWELCSDARNKKIRKKSFFTEGDFKGCSIKAVYPDFR